MGGNWDHGKVKDWQKLHNVGDDAFEADSPEDIEGTWQWSITKGLAIRMSSIGIWKVTADNVEKIYIRSHMVDKLHGCILYQYKNDKHEDYAITFADIERRIGLTATAETLSDAAFKTRVYDELVKKAKRDLNTEKRAIEKQAASA